MTVLANKAVGRGVLARDDQTRILIAGSHRSGTTWVGGFLGRGRDSVVITEPFSREHGILGVSHWFPFADGHAKAYKPLIDKFLLTRRARFRPDIPGRTWLRAAFRYVFPDQIQRDYARTRSNPPAGLVIKDPLASMAAEHMIVRFGFKAVFLVKHPCAFYDSLLRVGWEKSLPLEDFWEQSRGRVGRRCASRIRHPAERAGLIWHMIYENALRLRERYPDQCRIVRHEDLCLDPERELAALAAFCGLPVSEEMSTYAAATTSGEAVRPDTRVVHELYRNSSALAGRWLGVVTPADLATLRRETASIASRLYPEPW